MLFYALRVVCQDCGAAFLIGGGGKHDLSDWRRPTVECRRCGGETSMEDAQAVELRSLRPEGAPSDDAAGPVRG